MSAPQSLPLPAPALLAALQRETGFTPYGNPVGNLTLGRGTMAGVAAHIALIENRIASGSLGVKECDKLAHLFRIVALEKKPLILYLDSAGARLSEGLAALGAFRWMFREALSMVRAGAPVSVCLGANCFGGASMLAALAGTRVFAANTLLAMSGPSILAQSAGGSALDEMFRAITQAAIGVDARVRVSPTNTTVWQSVSMPVMPSWADLHAALKGRLKLEARPYEPIQHRALELLYPQGYEVFEQAGVLHGSAQDGEGPIALLGVINRKLMGANVAWGLADRIYAMVSKPPQRLHVLVDCEGHSTALDDERVMLSSYLVNVALALGELAQGGTQIETTVLGKVGGGVYVALAAVAKVNVLYGAEVQTLPSKAIASILGEAKLSQPEFAEHVKARVAESELKIGLV